jgi:hypothetical protein
VYAFYAGYWGIQVGFYGGVNYGFVYGGGGSAGGEWRGGVFAYKYPMGLGYLHQSHSAMAAVASAVETSGWGTQFRVGREQTGYKYFLCRASRQAGVFHTQRLNGSVRLQIAMIVVERAILLANTPDDPPRVLECPAYFMSVENVDDGHERSFEWPEGIDTTLCSS